eukprot:4551779-Amphidinium_carterae.1
MGPASAELKLLLADVQAKASEGCGDATSICGLLHQNVRDGGNPVRPVLEVTQTAQAQENQVGPGGSCKRRAQSPLLDSQRAKMYRALSPSAATEDVNMDIATPRGTGGLSPPPAAAGTGQHRPPGALLLEQASSGAGVVASDGHKIFARPA